MAEIDAKTVMTLRKMTGAPMMDCKHALSEAGGDLEKARDVLRKKGLKTADNKAGREATEGAIFSYVHHNGKLAVLAEVTCETDFVASNQEFREFGRMLCMHIAAASPPPRFLTRADIDAATLEKEREIVLEQTRAQMAGKPDEVIQKAVDGRMTKFFSDVCLVDQPWIQDDTKTVDLIRKELVGRIGENIQIRRFVRIELGD
jgi:elongation factor Ts